MTKGEKAKSYFMNGYNCSQAVALAFADDMNMSEESVARLTIGFGGGMGRMREVCGAMSGITFVISALYGNESKNDVYKMVQTVAAEFKAQNGSIVCKELLGLAEKAPITPNAEKRTDTYYKKRPCPLIVASAADALDEFIKSN